MGFSASSPLPTHSRSGSFDGSTACPPTAAAPRHARSLSGGRTAAPLPPATPERKPCVTTSASQRSAATLLAQAASAGGKVVPGPPSASNVLVVHTDAIRRRREAEERCAGSLSMALQPPESRPRWLDQAACFSLSLVCGRHCTPLDHPADEAYTPLLLRVLAGAGSEPFSCRRRERFPQGALGLCFAARYGLGGRVASRPGPARQHSTQTAGFRAESRAALVPPCRPQ